MSTAETTRINKDLANNVNNLAAQVTSKPNISYREKKHVEAVVSWSRGNLSKAAQAWEDVLVEVFFERTIEIQNKKLIFPPFLCARK